MQYKPLPNAALIRRAHHRFLDTGTVMHGVVPEAIERSWLRCASHGVQPDRLRELARLARGEFTPTVERYAPLIAVAEPVMQTLNQQLQGTGSIVVLCAPDGLILRSHGDADFLPRAEQVALTPGVSWAEEQKGTNAIGTAIVEQAPVVVYGAQHYVASNHSLTCSAAPLFDASGALAAVLDITSDYRAHQTHTLALARMASRTIERQMFLHAHRGAFVLQLHRQANYLGSLFDGRAAFAADGTLLAADQDARELLELGPAVTAPHFEDLFEGGLGDLLRRSRHGEPVFHLRLRRRGTQLHGQFARGLPGTPPAGERAAVQAVAPPAIPVHPALEALHHGDLRMEQAARRVMRVLGHDIGIVLEGETGTGKELFARAVHDSGPRAGGPFVAINCAAIPEGLIEAELFGYVDGAFTGARRKGQPGRLQSAHGGTLFLDEIGDMPPALQPRLLRVLQEREVTPLGGGRPQRVEFSLLCASHRDLRDLVTQGAFREDLYYRITGLTVRLPPLRERNDREALIRHLAQRESLGGAPVRIADDAMARLLEYPWPGNIRQLHAVLRTALVLGDSGRDIELTDLPEDVQAWRPENDSALGTHPAASPRLAQLEWQAIQQAVQANQGNMSAAARQLGIGRATLYRKLKSNSL